MSPSNQQRVKKLHRLHSKKREVSFTFHEWLSSFFWDPAAKEQILTYLEALTQNHGKVGSVRSMHPVGKERTPIHLPYIYRHELCFSDGFIVVLFQKYNFSKGFTSFFTALTWSYLACLSRVFRTHHRRYEKKQGCAVWLVHPNPRSLWENYKTFLSTLGVSWKKNNDTALGPVWLVLTDTTAVTLAVPGTNMRVGDTVYSQLINAVHDERFQKKRLETLGFSLAQTLRSCYEQRVAFVDVGLGNYIIDGAGRARFIDGELLQEFPTSVPSHFKALELVMFMETLYLETVRDYSRTVQSTESEQMQRYQFGVVFFFSAFLQHLELSKEELTLAQEMYHDWSTKASTFFFTVLLSLHHDSQVIQVYRRNLTQQLGKILDNHIKKHF